MRSSLKPMDEIDRFQISLGIKAFDIRKNAMRLQILVIVCLASGLVGCAGDGKSTKTQNGVETGLESQIAESVDGFASEGQGEQSEFFDPFDESDDAPINGDVSFFLASACLSSIFSLIISCHFITSVLLEILVK